MALLSHAVPLKLLFKNRSEFFSDRKKMHTQKEWRDIVQICIYIYICTMQMHIGTTTAAHTFISIEFLPKKKSENFVAILVSFSLHH